RIGGEIPLVFLGGLHAQPLDVGAQEPQARFLGDPIRVLGGVFSELPVGGQLADLRLGEVLDRLAVGLGGDGRDRRAADEPPRRDQREDRRGAAAAWRRRQATNTIGVGGGPNLTASTRPPPRT